MDKQHSLQLQKTSTRNLEEAELRQLIEQNSSVFDEYIDTNYSKSLETNVFQYINQHYFRAAFYGFEDFPKRNNPERPLIFAGNHSGMAFPWDAMVFGAGIYQMVNHDLKHMARPLASPALSETVFMNPYLIRDFWKRCGAIDATSLNFETMMHYNHHNVLIYPEGVPGIGKGWNRRYQLQRFSTSMIRMSLKYQTDIIPVLTVNGEYINPYAYSVPWVNRLFQKVGIPFMALGWTLLLVILQPWAFYFAFPAKLIYVKGRRLSPYLWTDKPFEALTEEEIQAIRDRVQTSMQEDLDEAVKEHGSKPYRWGELLRYNVKQMSRLPYFFSFGFCLLFHEHDRRYRKNKKEEVDFRLTYLTFFTALARNPFCLVFFVPVVGWIPIAIRSAILGRKR